MKSMVDVAKYYIERGFSPLPVPAGANFPNRKGWTDLRIDDGNVKQYFNGKFQNVAVLMGDEQGHVDVDLDCEEARRVADAFLPSTEFIFGRKSNPASHRFYRSKPCPVRTAYEDPLRKGKDKHAAMLVELRGSKQNGDIGYCALVPGSVHVSSGETYDWEPNKDGLPAEVEVGTLEQAVARVAAAALLARHWPGAGGGRHNCMLALAGALARAKWKEADALYFCSTLYASLPTYDRKAVKRVATEVKSSFQKVAESEPATGAPTLTDYLDPKVAECALAWLTEQSGSAISAIAPELRQQLITTQNGGIRACLANAVTVMAGPEWKDVLRYNEFSGRAEFAKEPPIPRRKPGDVWRDEDNAQLCCWLQHKGVLVGTEVAREAVGVVAREISYHPVRDYLNGLTWDGQPRLDTWLSLYLGAANNQYTRAVGSCWLISAVARIFEPGCKADHVPLFIGPQGALKSSALRIVAVRNEWFTDHLPDLRDKDSRIVLMGKLIVEDSEFRPRPNTLEAAKGFFSAQFDCFRRPYGRDAENVPRQNVFAATTNSDTPLNDETGNRRFWPVVCGKIDLNKLSRDCNQLWAEAVAHYRKGEKWWLDTPKLNDLAQKEQSKCYEPGVWDDLILSWIKEPVSRLDRRKWCDSEPTIVSNPERVVIDELLEHAISMDKERWTHGARLQVRRCLVHAGWKRRQLWLEQKPRWFYVRPS